MIDPVIFSTEIFGITFTLRWYGVIVMIGVIVGALIVERGLKYRGEKGDRIWDALIWVLPAGIIGARLWYVFNAVLGGNRSYLDNPASIFRVWEGGLHIFGGFLFGAIALLYLRQNKLDPSSFWMPGPAVLIRQRIGRLANFISKAYRRKQTSVGIPISGASSSIQDLAVSLRPLPPDVCLRDVMELCFGRLTVMDMASPQRGSKTGRALRWLADIGRRWTRDY
jgi:prolipoprotein diacylglyceryltransferase